jgi:hypothetical protein
MTYGTVAGERGDGRPQQHAHRKRDRSGGLWIALASEQEVPDRVDHGRAEGEAEGLGCH